MKLLKLFSDFSITKALDSSEEEFAIYITGYANTTAKDRQGDVIPSYAWNETSLLNYRKNPIILAYHNHSQPIGSATEIDVDAKGLKITARISSAAKEVYQLVSEGILKTFSVGFIVKDADYDQVSDVFVIKELELLEVSVVSVPANQDSIFNLAKAFSSDEELAEFKKSFIKSSASDEGDENNDSSESTETSEQKDTIMEQSNLEAIIKSAIDTAAATAAASALEVGKSGAERLQAEIEKRLADDSKSVSEALDGLRSELAAKSEEIAKLRENKMSFEDRKAADSVTYKDKETAVLIAKALGRKVEDTKNFANLVTKYGAHVPSAYWEDTVSTALQEEIRRRLIVAPLFNSVSMPSSIVRMPVNPEAGYATWIQTGEYKAATSSGAAQTHALKEITLTSHKLATKEFIGNEEEEDALIAIMPIVRDAMVRRTAKAWDRGLLLGAASAADPIKGLVRYEAAGSNTTLALATAATTGTLRTLRKNMGVWGLDPADVVYVVNQDVYYNLLEDATFQTMDKVGERATVLTGQIGMVGGSPVIVTGELPAKALGGFGAVALNARNFMIGNYRGLNVESDYQVVEQQRVLVASLRTGFQQISIVDGEAVSCLRYTA